MNPIIDQIEKSQLRQDVPDFRVGDTVRINLKIVEGQSERVQAFEGVVIRRKGHGLGETFTVRKLSFGVGVERTLPLHSPRIESFKKMKSGKVRRAKLYYLRDLRGKAARIAEEGAAESPSAGSAPASAAAASPSSPPETVGATK